MKLLEHQAKDLFREYGISVPRGYLASEPSMLQKRFDESVIKAQVPIGGRGKAGGIRFAKGIESIRKAVDDVLSMEIGGFEVLSVLIEERLGIVREIYISITIDRSRGLPLLLASTEGGVEIESVPDERIGRWYILPSEGVSDFAEDVAKWVGLSGGQMLQFEEMLASLWSLFWEKDCELVEINPLVIDFQGRIIASDAKIVVNDDALFRHPELPQEVEDLTPLERKAREKGIAFVQLDGKIGVIANGAGLTMATLDTLSLHGGKGGVFLDLGGTDDVDQVVEAFKLMAEAAPKVILINIFGGITKCDTVAMGIVRSKEELGINAPMVARIRGVNEKEAGTILEEKGIFALRGIDEACRKAIELEGSS